MDRLWSYTLLALVLGLAALAGCGGRDEAFMPVPGADGAYCSTYRAWKVYELDHGEGFDQPTSAALRKWWNTYLIKEETLLQQAPPEILDEVVVKVSHIRTVMTPLIEAYGFDLKRVRRDGRPAEQAALFGLPPADVQKAQEVEYAYVEKTCGTSPSPPSADVVLEADESSKPFCKALSAFDEELAEVASSRFDPEVLRAFVTGDGFTELLDRLNEAAPPEIAADVEADTEWFRTRWNDVVAKHDYDLRGIYLNGTPEDLAVFNRTHPDVLEHSSRDTAYEEQVCGG